LQPETDKVPAFALSIEAVRPLYSLAAFLYSASPIPPVSAQL
jgi:hypothetical protein